VVALIVLLIADEALNGTGDFTRVTIDLLRHVLASIGIHF
jgi:hypothetical protein